MPGLTVIVCVEFDHRAPVEGLRTFKSCIAQCAYVESVMETSGSYDLIVQAHFSELSEYTERMDSIAVQLQQFVKRVESNFVGKKVDRRHSTGHALWLPCDGGHKRVSANLIDKVIADGDYMKVFVGTWTCMVHDTIKHMCEELTADAQFIQLHRSVIVRTDFIERLLHQDRRWIAKLRDGTTQRVAKSHVPDILRMMSAESSTGGVVSSTSGDLDEQSAQANEMRMRVLS